MGCDIHVHVEIKRDGRWLHLNEVQVQRNYHLFGKMAGVRDEDAKPIAPPRGVPDDMSEITKLCYDRMGIDAHTPSWLTGAEAGEVEDWFEKTFPHRPGGPLFGYVLGNYVNSHVKWEDTRKAFKEMGVEDVRVVFWFDN